MKYSIYLITNKINDKKYIGATTKDVKSRWTAHINGRSKCKAINEAINFYGPNSFIFEIVDITSKTKEEMFLKEIEYIKYYNSFGLKGYNLTTGGEGSRGHILSDRARKKIKDARAKQIFSQESINKLSEHGKKDSPAYKKRFTKKVKNKLSISQSNRMKNGYNPKATKWIVTDDMGIIKEIILPTTYFNKSFKSFWSSYKNNRPIQKGKYAGWKLVEIVKL